MSIDERILAILTTMQTSVASIKVSQAETNARLDKLEIKTNMLEVNHASVNARLDKIMSNQAALYEKSDKLEAKVMKLEAGQTYINRKLDSIAIEFGKVLKSLNAIDENKLQSVNALDEYKDQMKSISKEVESLSVITKENMFNIAQLKHR